MTEPTFEAGPLLVRARRVADLSQRDLARLAGVPQASVAALESGTRGVRLEVFARLVAASGLRLAVLRPDGEEVAPFAADAVRDNGGRRFPAHLDVLPPDGMPAERISSPRYDRAEAKGWYHLRRRRDLAREAGEVKDGHPTEGELEYRRLQRRYGRARWWPHREAEIRGRLGLEPADEQHPASTD